MQDIMTVVKGIVILALVVIVGIIVYVAIAFIAINPMIMYVLLGLLGVLVLAAFVYALYFMIEKISGRRALMRHQKLEIERKKAEIEDVAESRRAAFEQRRAADEARRFEQWLRVEELRLRSEAQNIMHFKQDEVLAVHRGGGQMEIAYVPMPRLEARGVVMGDKVVVTEETEVIALPAPRRVPGALELIEAGALDGDDLLLGFDVDGRPVRKIWKQIKSILILGLPGGGKTNTASWIIMQELRRGARLAMIDKHARSDESMYAKLQAFKAVFDTPVGDSPKAAMRVLKHVRRVLDERIDSGKAGYKLIFAVDEITAIFRTIKDDTSDWQEVAVAFQALLEDVNTEGRKYGVHAVAVGQASNASRSGGTEVRDIFTTRLVHGMRARQAQMLGLTEEKKDIQRLETGQVYVDIEGREDPFFMQVPQLKDEVMEVVASRLAPASQARTSRNLREQTARTGGFAGSSGTVQTHSVDRSTGQPERATNEPTNYDERMNERAKRVLELRKIGTGKASIIEEVWSVKKGGSDKYKQAEAEYEQIIENLVNLGYLQVN